MHEVLESHSRPDKDPHRHASVSPQYFPFIMVHLSCLQHHDLLESGVERRIGYYKIKFTRTARVEEFHVYQSSEALQ
jgi:hypothetical protein